MISLSLFRWAWQSKWPCLTALYRVNPIPAETLLKRRRGSKASFEGIGSCETHRFAKLWAREMGQAMERGQLGCNGQLRFGHKVVGPFRYPEGLAVRVNVKLDMQESRWSNWNMLVTVNDLLVVVKSCSITGSWCSGIVNHIASRSRWSDIPCPAQAFPDAILWGTPGIMVELSLPAEMCSRMYFTYLFFWVKVCVHLFRHGANEKSDMFANNVRVCHIQFVSIPIVMIIITFKNLMLKLVMYPLFDPSMSWAKWQS